MSLQEASKNWGSKNLSSEKLDTGIHYAAEDSDENLFPEWGMIDDEEQEQELSEQEYEELFPEWNSEDEDTALYREDELEEKLALFKKYLDEEIFLDNNFGNQPCSVYRRIMIVEDACLAAIDQTLETLLGDISADEAAVLRKYYGFNQEQIAYDIDTIARQLNLSEKDVLALKDNGLGILKACESFLTEKKHYHTLEAFYQSINEVINEKFDRLDQSIIDSYMENNHPYLPLLVSLIDAEENPYKQEINIEISDEWATLQKLHDLDEEDHYEIVSKAVRSRNLIGDIFSVSGLSVYEKLILLHMECDMDNVAIKSASENRVLIEGPSLRNFWENVVVPIGELANDRIASLIQDRSFLDDDVYFQEEDIIDWEIPVKKLESPIKPLYDQVKEEMNSCYNGGNIIGKYVHYDWSNDEYYLTYENDTYYQNVEEIVGTRHDPLADGILRFIDDYKLEQFSRLSEAIKEIELSFMDLLAADVERALTDYGKSSETNVIIEQIIRKRFGMNESDEFTSVEELAKQFNQPAASIWPLCRQGVYELRHQNENPIRDNQHYQKYFSWLEKIHELILEGFEYTENQAANR